MVRVATEQKVGLENSEMSKAKNVISETLGINMKRAFLPALAAATVAFGCATAARAWPAEVVEEVAIREGEVTRVILQLAPICRATVFEVVPMDIGGSDRCGHHRKDSQGRQGQECPRRKSAHRLPAR